MKKVYVALLLLYCVIVSLSHVCWSREIADRESQSEILGKQLLEDILSISKRMVTDKDGDKAYYAHERLGKYIDDLDTAIEKKDARQADLTKKREALAGKLSDLMKRNAEMVERKLPENVNKSKIDFTTEVHPDQQGRFDMATALLAGINDQQAIDTLVGHIDRRWPRYYITNNGLIFGMRNHYPAALALARAPTRCQDLLVSRLVYFVANTEDTQKHKYCAAVLHVLCGGKKGAIEKLKISADGEKDPVKKGRLRKQIEILDKEAPDFHDINAGGGLVD